MATKTARLPKLVPLKDFTPKRRSSAPVLLFVTDAEWRSLTKGLKPATAEEIPDAGILFTPVPGGYVGAYRCPKGMTAVRYPDGSWNCEPTAGQATRAREMAWPRSAWFPCRPSFLIEKRHQFGCTGSCSGGLRCERRWIIYGEGVYFFGCICAPNPSLIPVAGTRGQGAGRRRGGAAGSPGRG